MGSLRALVMLASLSACETSGIEVVVLQPTEGARPDQIRLFVGMPDEGEASIAPEGFPRLLARKGNVWVRDPDDGRDLVTDVSPGEIVSFGFVLASDVPELGAVIAVGYTGGVPTSAGSLFHVLSGVDRVQMFKLQLYAAVDPRDPTNDYANRSAPVQLEIWGPNPGDETCVHLANSREDADAEHLHRTTFIVSPDDRDCDGRTSPGDPLECTGDVYNGSRPPSRSDLSCATIATNGGGAGSSSFCVLGGPRCTDGAERVDTECSPSRFCAPPSLCTTCNATSDPWACLTDPLLHTAALPTTLGIKCHVPTSGVPGDAQNQIDVCNQPMLVKLPMPTNLASPQCSRAMVRTLTEPFADRLEFDQLRFDVAVDDACEFSLTPSGNFMYGSFPQRSGGLVTVDLANGRGLALPLHLVFDQPTSACAASIGCVIIGELTDRPLACLTAPPP